MSLSEQQVLAAVERLSVSRLRIWVQSGCVRPGADSDATAPGFTEADVARLRLLCELQDDLNVNDDALPLVLSLIDQLHGLRRQLRALAQAVEEQPGSVRDAILRRLRAVDAEA